MVAVVTKSYIELLLLLRALPQLFINQYYHVHNEYYRVQLLVNCYSQSHEVATLSNVERSKFKFETCRYLAKHCPFACVELFERSLALQLYGTYYSVRYLKKENPKTVVHFYYLKKNGFEIQLNSLGHNVFLSVEP